jgi:putative transposase
MKKSRLTDSQILAVIKQAKAGTPVPLLCREHALAQRRFTSGAASSAAWMRR